MLKSSKWIKEQCEKNELINPFVDHSVRDNVVSYGLGPYGYDIRLDKTYKKLIYKDVILSPHTIKEEHYETLENEEKIVLEPNTYILAKSYEYFNMPSKVLGLVFGKSTYARLGIVVNVTPLEPEWSGYLTISISNTSCNRIILKPFQGIAQMIFLESDDLPFFTYKDLNGKYNEQKEITISKIT